MGSQAMGSDPTVLEELRLNQIGVMFPTPNFFLLVYSEDYNSLGTVLM